MSSCSIHIGEMYYHRQAISEILPIMEHSSEIKNVSDMDDNVCSALTMFFSIDNRNKYVQYKIEEMFIDHEFSNNEEFEIRKWLFVDYYLENRIHQCTEFSAYLKRKLIKLNHKSKSIMLTIKRLFNKKYFHEYNNYINDIDHHYGVLEKVEKELHQLLLMSNYVKATIEMKNTSLFRVLHV